VDGAADLVDGLDAFVHWDGVLTLSGIHSGAEVLADLVVLVAGVEVLVAGAVVSADGAEVLVDGADGTLTLLDTGTHTDQFTMVAV